MGTKRTVFENGEDTMGNGITFVLPTLANAAMSKDDQGALIVNQATAVIVAAYLQYAAPGAPWWDNARLVSLIDDVQNALKQF